LYYDRPWQLFLRVCPAHLTGPGHEAHDHVESHQSYGRYLLLSCGQSTSTTYTVEPSPRLSCISTFWTQAEYTVTSSTQTEHEQRCVYIAVCSVLCGESDLKYNIRRHLRIHFICFCSKMPHCCYDFAVFTYTFIVIAQCLINQLPGIEKGVLYDTQTKETSS